MVAYDTWGEWRAGTAYAGVAPAEARCFAASCGLLLGDVRLVPSWTKIPLRFFAQEGCAEGLVHHSNDELREFY
jgi:hypothetical protein